MRAALIQAFGKTVRVIGFPQTPILDTFTGTNGTALPVYNATNWQAGGGGNTDWEIQSNQAAPTAGGLVLDYWIGALYGVNHEFYFTNTVKPGDNAQNRIIAIDSATANGYSLVYTAFATTDFFQLRLMNAGAQGAQIGTDITQETANGDSWGFRKIGTALQCWYKPSAGVWTLLRQETDATYAPTSVVCALQCEDNPQTTRIDNFGGGTI